MIKDFFILDFYFMSKTESLLYRIFLYLLKYVMLPTKMHLYLGQLRKKLIAITFTLNYIHFQPRLLPIYDILQYIYVRITIISALEILQFRFLRHLKTLLSNQKIIFIENFDEIFFIKIRRLRRR